MVIPVPDRFPVTRCRGARAAALVMLVAAAFGTMGCSVDLSSLSPSAAEPEKQQTAQVAVTNNLGSLTEAIKNNPNDPQAYNMRGLVLAQAGKTEEALADFNKAISLDPNSASAFANRGLVYRKTGRPDQAMADYDRAIVLDASHAPAYLGRGLVHKAQKQP